MGMGKEGSKDEKAANAWKHWRGAIAPALALIAIGVLPGMLKGLYESYTDKLMLAYVTFGMLFTVAVFGGLAIMVFRDMSTRRQKVFRLAPGEQPVREADGLVRVEEDHSENR
jgi:hypothetical protein